MFHATSDADVLIMQKAIDSADIQDTVVMGDYTDLLVLSLHKEPLSHKLYFAPQPKRNAKARINSYTIILSYENVQDITL